MEYSKFTGKGIEIIIEIDKISESGYYQAQNGDLKILCENTAKKEWQLCLDANLKGTYIEKYKAISEKQLAFMNKVLDAEIDYLEKKLPKISSNGAGFGMALFTK